MTTRSGQRTEKPPRTAWKVSEVAASLGVDYDTALAQVKAGRIKSFKFGRQYLVPDAELQALLASAA